MMRTLCSAHRETPGLKFQGDRQKICRAAARLGDLTGGDMAEDLGDQVLNACTGTASATGLHGE